MSIFRIPEGRRATRDVSSKQLLSDGSGYEVDRDDEEDDAIENRCELGPALTLGINRNGVADPACPDQAKKRSGADVEVKAVENDVQEIRRDLRNDPETKTSDGGGPDRVQRFKRLRGNHIQLFGVHLADHPDRVNGQNGNAREGTETKNLDEDEAEQDFRDGADRDKEYFGNDAPLPDDRSGSKEAKGDGEQRGNGRTDESDRERFDDLIKNGVREFEQGIRIHAEHVVEIGVEKSGKHLPEFRPVRIPERLKRPEIQRAPKQRSHENDDENDVINPFLRTGGIRILDRGKMPKDAIERLFVPRQGLISLLRQLLSHFPILRRSPLEKSCKTNTTTKRGTKIAPTLSQFVWEVASFRSWPMPPAPTKPRMTEARMLISNV